jgi:hypothetical protein
MAYPTGHRGDGANPYRCDKVAAKSRKGPAALDTNRTAKGVQSMPAFNLTLKRSLAIAAVVVDLTGCTPDQYGNTCFHPLNGPCPASYHLSPEGAAALLGAMNNLNSHPYVPPITYNPALYTPHLNTGLGTFSNPLQIEVAP